MVFNLFSVYYSKCLDVVAELLNTQSNFIITPSKGIMALQPWFKKLSRFKCLFVFIFRCRVQCFKLVRCTSNVAHCGIHSKVSDILQFSLDKYFLFTWSRLFLHRLNSGQMDRIQKSRKMFFRKTRRNSFLKGGAKERRWALRGQTHGKYF